MECGQGDCQEGAVEQAALRSGRFLRRQSVDMSEGTLYHGSGLASALCDEHVHPSDEGRAGVVRARLHRLQRFEGEGGELQGAGA